MDEKVDNPLQVKNFKVNGYITRNSEIRVYESSELESGEHKKNALAEMLCSQGDRTCLAGLYGEHFSEIQKRVESNEQQFVESVQLTKLFSGTAYLVKIKTNYDLIQAIVEANKQIHLLSLPESDESYQIKFASLTGYACPTYFPESEGILTADNIGVKENEQHKLTMSRFHLELKGSQMDFNMCYSFLNFS